MRVLSFLFFTSFIISCSHLSSVSQTSIPKKKGKVVEAKVERNIFFLFNFNNEYVNALPQKLMDQCPRGSVRGILTKDEDIVYFPIVFHKNVVTASGFCVDSGRKQARKKTRNAKKRR